MNAATEFYSKAWDVEDVHGTESYDLICRRGGEVKHVEIKGTTTDGEEVILTPNEVRHAQENPSTALFVVTNITVERAEDGTVSATGGRRHRYDPWRLSEGTLTPLGFAIRYPPRRTRHLDWAAFLRLAADSNSSDQRLPAATGDSA